MVKLPPAALKGAKNAEKNHIFHFFPVVSVALVPLIAGRVRERFCLVVSIFYSSKANGKSKKVRLINCTVPFEISEWIILGIAI